MHTESDTFNELKYGKYKLTVTILPDTEDQIDDILDGLRTTLSDQGPYNQVDDEGNCISILTVEELTEEIFCLGICYRELELDLEMEHPFEYNVEKLW